MIRLPDDEVDAPTPPLFSLGFWAALATGVALMLAGAGVAIYGPALFPAAKPPHPLPITPAPPSQRRFDTGYGAWQGSRPHRL